MTVSQSIIKWLKIFNPAEYWKMDSISTDLQPSVESTYTLIKEPVQNVKKYLGGRRQYTDHYTIMARLSSQTNTDRIENGAWGEALTSFIEKSDENSIFPVLDNGVVKSISVTTPFYLGKTETNDSLYQMTIGIKYEKEN